MSSRGRRAWAASQDPPSLIPYKNVGARQAVPLHLFSAQLLTRDYGANAGGLAP